MRALHAAVLAAALGAAGPALASDFDISADVGVVSDYVDRGLSLSDEDPAVQGGLFVDHDSGIYLAGFASTVDDPGNHDVEIEGIVGYTLPVGAYELDLTASYDSFHGNGDSFGFAEFGAKASRDFGLVYLAAGLSYAPDGRWFVRNEDTVYTYGEIELPVPTLPWLAVVSHVGYEAITDARDRTDWSLGLSAGAGPLQFSLSYRDSDSRAEIGDARIVGGIRLFF